MKVSGQHMSSVGIDSPLTIIVEGTFQNLRKDKVLVLPKLNECALKDCIAISPRIIASTFTKISIQDSFYLLEWSITKLRFAQMYMH